MPISGHAFLERARAVGFDSFVGVPCSYLTPLLNAVINDSHARAGSSGPESSYIGATSEGEAIGIAAGMWLAGRHPMVLAQNSGLGNMVNPVTSLLATLRIPVTMLITWRGQPGHSDEPQHSLMGRITEDLCSLLGLSPRRLSDSLFELEEALASASEAATARESRALLLPDGVIAPAALEVSGRDAIEPPVQWFGDARAQRPSRADCIRAVLDAVPATAAVIASTGKCARELFTIQDEERQLYVVGSMGCASALALGVALNADRSVVVLDGDGAALMKMGNFATIGAASPSHLIHIILDNGVHDSTGGQPTVSGGVIDFTAIAAACGYRFTASIGSVAEVAEAVRLAKYHGGPAMLHVRTAPGSMERLGRPTIPPDAVAQRFREFLARD